METLTIETHHLTLGALVTTPTASCPTCAQPARRLHSRSRRTLADLPWAALPVRLSLQVRRFFCDIPSCGRQTFTERVPTVARPYAHTTTRASQAQCDTGLVLGGAAGARQLARQGLPGSRQTVLRRIRDYQPASQPAPQVIGIDDWAYRKGRRYGTIVVDLAQGCPVDLLEDRLAETVAAWLRAHPEVTVVARDRADAYASGVSQGAPDAIQVADRWHLLKNLREAIEVEFCQRPSLPWSPPLPEARRHTCWHPRCSCAEAPSALHVLEAPEAPVGPRADVARAARRAQRLAQYERARALRDEGYPGRSSPSRSGWHSARCVTGSRGRAFPSGNVAPATGAASLGIGRICGSAGRPGNTARRSCGTSCAPKASVGGTGAWPGCWPPGASGRSGADVVQRLQQWLSPLRRPRH